LKFIGVLIALFLLLSCSSISLGELSYVEAEPLHEMENTVLLKSADSWPQLTPHLKTYSYTASPDGLNRMDLSYQWPMIDVKTNRAEIDSQESKITETIVESVQQEPDRVISETPPQREPLVQWMEKNEQIEAGDHFTLVLDGGGWSWQKEQEDGSFFVLQQRFVDLQSTRFQFLSPDPGDYTLVFEKADPRNGSTLAMKYVVILSEKTSPVVEPSENRNPQQESLTLSSKEDYLKALEEIDEEKDDPSEVISLLEGIISFQWGDEDYAGYLYRLALQLERNGVHQDLNRANDIYHTIRDSYFLTSYFEKAQSRILYLNRHFFLLQ